MPRKGRARRFRSAAERRAAFARMNGKRKGPVRIVLVREKPKPPEADKIIRKETVASISAKMNLKPIVPVEAEAKIEHKRVEEEKVPQEEAGKRTPLKSKTQV